FALFGLPPLPELRQRSTHLPSYLRGKVFLPKTREWKDARLKEVGPGHEFVADNRLFKVLDQHRVAECPEIDVSKLAEADRPFDPANWRVPNANDVVYVPGKDFPDSGHCLLSHVKPHRRFRFQGRYYFLQPGQALGRMDLIDTSRVDRPADEDDASWQV